jgi:hypothetical protein
MKDEVLKINPYTVAADKQGWRGLSVAGNCKRRVYTVLQNEQVLVTALLLVPGERSIRHSHESGELSIHYSGDLKPIVTWNPPGLLHAGPPPKPDGIAETLKREIEARSGSPEVAKLVEEMFQLRQHIEQLQEMIQQMKKPDPSPRIIIDVLFPPFKTTIDDPAYSEKKTIIGQWYD